MVILGAIEWSYFKSILNHCHVGHLQLTLLLLSDTCDTATCFPNAQCFVQNGRPMCRCLPGFQLLPVQRACIDIDECKASPCGVGAFCENAVGTFKCKCPAGTSGDPTRECTLTSPATSRTACKADSECQPGETCISASGECVCRRGYDRNPKTGKCEDINECLTASVGKPVCGVDAVCKNLPGSYDCECPKGFSGNPFSRCEKCAAGSCSCQPPYQLVGDECRLAGCSTDKDCSANAQCVKIAGGVSYCACPPGYRPGADGGCEDVNECTESLLRPCGLGALCENKPGSFSCTCPPGSTGDAYNSVCTAVRTKCTSDNQCRENEKCLTSGECVCSPPFFTDSRDGNRCKSPCDQFRCGLNSECTPTNPPQCLCKAGYTGNPLTGCEDVDECRNTPCGGNARCLNEAGSYICQCPPGTKGDPYITGCSGSASTGRSECTKNEDCPGQLTCQGSRCINPCSSLPCGDNAVCVPEAHAAWCKCKSGFKEDASGKCVSECLGMTCGQNAQCIVSQEGPVCVCHEGMMGNPFPGGSCSPVVCSVRSPCPGRNQVCESGRCVDACGGKNCGLNAHCNSDTKTCVCREGFIGDPQLLCMPPVGPPACNPGCGTNSHCEYASPNRCVCDKGFAGNPYTGCQTLEHQTCASIQCGLNAACSISTGVPQCVCGKGYTGNPYSGCYDLDECSANVCGVNAVCINIPGSYDCRCKFDFVGNPFEACTAESKEEIDDLCNSVHCGPNAVCNLGQCLCAPGFEGDNPNDPAVGCSAISKCTYDTDCGYNEVCATNQNGISRRCVDACSRASCGQNAFCVTDNHHMTCVCNDGFSGDPTDLQKGCFPEKKCKQNSDCAEGLVCQININGRRTCLDPCQIMSCPDTEKCKVIDGRPLCTCKEGHTKNKLTGVCEIVAGCTSDAQCRPSEVCREGVFGTRTCVDVCNTVVCPSNSICVADNHKGFCKCNPGYSGTPDSRVGCFQSVKGCSNDAQCKEAEVCRVSGNQGTCVQACSALRCGPSAICMARNHIGKCTCPPGLFTGDPYRDGCKAVNCIENDDCPADKFCDRLSYTCLNVCKADMCGEGAVCTIENHAHRCACPPGYQPDPSPEVRCSKLKDGEKCITGQCQLTCVTAQQCPDGQTCRDGICLGGCTDHRDCPGQHVCNQNRCQDPCSLGRSCGPNSVCTAQNKTETCKCPPGFAGVPTAREGCVRIPEICGPSDVCPAGQVCHGGFCMPACALHTDCARGEQCNNGVCLKLCHSDKNCLQGEICVNKFCQPGCNVDNDCKNGELCLNGQCSCAKGFIKTPQGCADIDECSNAAVPVCPPPMVCSNKLGSFDCRCPAGMVGDVATGCVQPDECITDAQCPEQYACALDPSTARRRCQDPCSFAFCTEKATCKTIQHKPFCSCPPRHRGDPTDPNIGCYKVECETSEECPGNRACDAKNLQCIGKYMLTVAFCLPNLSSEVASFIQFLIRNFFAKHTVP